MLLCGEGVVLDSSGWFGGEVVPWSIAQRRVYLLCQYLPQMSIVVIFE